MFCFTFYESHFAFVNTHLAAHMQHTKARNDDAKKVLHATLEYSFGRPKVDCSNQFDAVRDLLWLVALLLLLQPSLLLPLLHFFKFLERPLLLPNPLLLLYCSMCCCCFLLPQEPLSLCTLVMLSCICAHLGMVYGRHELQA